MTQRRRTITKIMRPPSGPERDDVACTAVRAKVERDKLVPDLVLVGIAPGAASKTDDRVAHFSIPRLNAMIF
jgi:hypothetical protein